VKGLSWVNFILGLWLIIAPFVLQYSADSAATWNSVVIGIVVAILSIVRALGHTSMATWQQQHHSSR